MAATHIALLRGINVGNAKRIAMADLRALLEGLGYRDVRTLLNSGNVVFSGTPSHLRSAETRIAAGITEQCGFSCRVIVISAAELAAIMTANPFPDAALDASRFLVAVLADAADSAKLTGLASLARGEERCATGSRAAYLWCVEGILASKLPDALTKAVGDAVTMRNWATLTKLQALADDSSHNANIRNTRRRGA